MKSLQSNLTLEEIHAKDAKLRKEVKDEQHLWNTLAYEFVLQHNLKSILTSLSFQG